MTRKVRTRFAPSPTGDLHLGGARTALFAWLYARKHQGEFVLRIEDTDRARSTQQSVNAILEGMQWLALDWDHGPFYQTERMERYQEVIEQLLAQGDAYRCDCSIERLDALRESQQKRKEKPRYDGHCRDRAVSSDMPHVIRFKTPVTGSVSFEDLVRGPIHVSNAELDDLIIVRTDGMPTYNLTVVVDDHDMQITHVLRGDDHINNTPRQIHLAQALGFPLPLFGHLPMILGPDGERLSKRHGASSVMSYQAQGYLPEALLNFLVRLGWSYGDQEKFTKDEMIAFFDPQQIQRSPAAMNMEKLDWLNQHYLRERSLETLVPLLEAQLSALGVDYSNGPDLVSLLRVQRERVKTLKQLAEESVLFFTETVNLDTEAAKKQLRPVTLDVLTALYDAFSSDQGEWDEVRIQERIHHVADQSGLKMGKVALPLRVAVTGGGATPAIHETLALIGKARVLKRLDAAMAYVKKRTVDA